jgi:mono/diheme cytochrome c family protein
MSKRTFIVFGLLVVVLAVLIPWLAFRSRGNADTGELKVPANLKPGQALFQTNCGTCHTLYAAGTDGNYAPNLDELLAPSGSPSGPTAASTIKATEARVLNALEHGVDTTTTPGRMPAGILNPQQGKEVAEFVAHTAGEG